MTVLFSFTHINIKKIIACKNAIKIEEETSSFIT